MKEEVGRSILDESQELVLWNFFEQAYVTIKSSSEIVSLGVFYGDPSCGLISGTDEWCIVGGSSLVIWTRSEIVKIDDEDLRWAWGIRQKEKFSVEILIDPWAENASVWEFNILTKEKTKIINFTKYKNKKFSDDVEW